MRRAMIGAALALAMAAGCSSSAKPADVPGCDAGEELVEQPVPALPKCDPVDAGAD